MAHQTPKQLIEDIEKSRKSPLITFYLKEGIILDDGCILPLYEQLKAMGKVPRIDLFLYSLGGITEIPWKLVSMIREFAKRFAVIVPYRAHSAATHIVLGADEIIMTPLSEISPVDPKRAHPLLPKGPDGNPTPISVQELKDALKFLRDEAGEFWNEAAYSNLYSKLFDHIHPIAVGAIEQSYHLSRLISRKMLEFHFDPLSEKQKIDRIIEALAGEFRSHAFPISRHEAKEELGLPVIYADDALWDKIEALYQHYRDKTNDIIQDSDGNKNIEVGFIESGKQSFVLEQKIKTTEQAGQMRDQLVGMGWKKI